MSATLTRAALAKRAAPAGITTTLAATLLLGGCAGMGETGLPQLASASPPPATDTATPGRQQTELERAVEYWGKEYGKNPRNLDAALAYAKNLKAMGQKSQALAVLQTSATFNGSDRRLASEYGRLALEMDQVGAAAQLLEAADDPANPDWRVISARGTALAKQGKYTEAIPFYERAMTLSREQPSILNNLAMAYMMSGQAQKAEPLLRQAAQMNGADTKVRQNLALVLGAQGRHDEAAQIAASAASPESAAYNADIMRRMVKADPSKTPPKATTQVARGQTPALKSTTATAAAATGWQPRVADAAEGSAAPADAFRGATSD